MTKFVLHAIIEEEMLNRLKISKTEQIFFKGAVTAAVLLAGIFALFYGIPCPFRMRHDACFSRGTFAGFFGGIPRKRNVLVGSAALGVLGSRFPIVFEKSRQRRIFCGDHRRIYRRLLPADYSINFGRN